MRPLSDWLETLPKDRLMAEMSLWSTDLARAGAETVVMGSLAFEAEDRLNAWPGSMRNRWNDAGALHE